MSQSKPEVRLHDQATTLTKIADGIELSADVCLAVNSNQPEKVVCAFSDISNNIETLLAELKTVINGMRRVLRQDGAFEDDMALKVTDRRATLQAVHDQCSDFLQLIDCAVEETPNNPRVFAAYYAMRLRTFIIAIRTQAEGIKGDLA